MHRLNTFDDDNAAQPYDEQRERPPRQRSPQRSGARRGGPTSGSHGVLRLAGLVALGIAIVFLLVFWIGSCGSSSQGYTSYVDAMQPIAKKSASVGNAFSRALGTPGLTMAKFQAKLAGWSQLEQAQYVAAQRLRPPGPLQSAHEQALGAIQLRYGGLQRLASTLAVAQQKHVRGGIVAAALASDAQSFTASDIVWEQNYRLPATDILATQGVTGVIVPTSRIVTNPAIVSALQLATLYARFSTPSTGHGTSGVAIHGSDLLYTNAVQNGTTTTQLSETTQTHLTAGSGLVIDVVFKNSGTVTEVNIPVTLTVGAGGASLSSQTKKVAQLASGATATVSFTNIQVPNNALSRSASLSVNVHKVKGEAKVDNNSATYPVFFILPPS